MWWKWISTASAGQGLAAVLRVLPHTQHPRLLQKSYQPRNTKEEVANCPAFPCFLWLPSKGWEYSLTYCTGQWFHSQRRALGAPCLPVATDNQPRGLARRHMSAWMGTMGTTEATLELKVGILLVSYSSYCRPQKEVSTHLTLEDVLYHETSTSRKHLLCHTEVTHQLYSNSGHTDHEHWRDALHLLPPTHIHLPLLSLMATVWDTQSPQRPMGFLLSAQSWGKKEPSACHACLNVAAGTRLLKWQPWQCLHEQVWSCARSEFGFRQVPGWPQLGAWTWWCCAQAVRVPAPRAWCSWYIRYHPLTIYFWSVSSLNFTDTQKISPCARRYQLKQNKQTPNPLVCSLDCKTYFQEQERASQELQKEQDNIWSTRNFPPQSKSCEYWLTLSYPNFITLDFTRKHVTCKWRHGLPHTQILLKQHTYFTYKSSGSRCTRLWYLIDIYRTWAHCSFILEHSLYSHHNSQDSK